MITFDVTYVQLDECGRADGGYRTARVEADECWRKYLFSTDRFVALKRLLGDPVTGEKANVVITSATEVTA